MLKVRGYASVFGNVDSYGEVVDAGAFSDWLADNPDTKLPLFWNHAHIWDALAKPIGYTTALRQDETGLYFEAEILDTADGAEVQEMVRSAGRVAASFAFSVRDQYQEDDVWHLSVLEPKEVTATNWGANPKAYVEAVEADNEKEPQATEENAA